MSTVKTIGIMFSIVGIILCMTVLVALMTKKLEKNTVNKLLIIANLSAITGLILSYIS